MVIRRPVAADVVSTSSEPTPERGAPLIVDLADAPAADPAVAGAKAASLAQCAGHGLPTLPGFVITTAAAEQLGNRSSADWQITDQLVDAWRALAAGDDGPVVVRSSSTAEDLASSSMAGQFRSVLDVRGRDAFLAAVDEVVASADRAPGPDGTPRPMGVLVQRQLDVVVGGVLFGVDPLTGDRDHLVVEAVPGRVDDLVSGAVTAAHYVLSRRGRVIDQARVEAAPPLTASLRRRLAALARDASRALGPAQDIEWALDGHDRLWMLQSRPVTAVAEGRSSARVFGPGPVAETFPDPLRRLEEDLWIVPLRDGIERALRACGAVSSRELDGSPILVTVRGRPAMDLELTGIAQGHTSLRRRLDPVEIVRRLGTAWRVGRLRVALPRLAGEVLERVDADLASIPPVDELEASTVVDLVDRARRELATVHQYEVLAGMLLHREPDGLPAPLLALDVLHEARRRDLGDTEAIATWPVLLSLVPPSLSPPRLPSSGPTPTHPEQGVDSLDEREGLRLRSRWLQELLAVAVRSLTRRLVLAGMLPDAASVRELTVAELGDAVRSGRVPRDLDERVARHDGAPLPAEFRLTASGGVLPRHDARRRTSGLPAAAGRAAGTARHRVAPGAPRDGTILITQHLEPSLAPLLPSLDGLVAETGSALSHLAILAREVGVPAVVGVADARRRFPPGTHVLVDGTIGDVHELRDPETMPSTAADEEIAT